MKHCLYIHQDYQPPKLSQYPQDEISCEQDHFPQVLCAKSYYKTMSNVFYVHFSTDDTCRPTDDFHGISSNSQITSRKTLIAQDRDFYFVKFYG